MLIALVAGVLLAAGLVIVIARSIVPPPRRVRDVLDAVAAGDLTRSADMRDRDELGAMANNCTRSLPPTGTDLAPGGAVALLPVRREPA